MDEFRSMLKGVEEEMLLKDSERAGKKRKIDGEAPAAGTEGQGPGAGDVGRAGEGTGGEGQEEGKVVGYTGLIDLGLLKTDISKLHPQVYWFWKVRLLRHLQILMYEDNIKRGNRRVSDEQNLLKEWEAWLEERPDDVKRSMEGKLASANWIQSSTNMKPLFKQLRNRVGPLHLHSIRLPSTSLDIELHCCLSYLPRDVSTDEQTVPLDVLAKLGEIALESQHRQYQKANDAYLRLSIGNAAWPIGVTSVGMHERGARERIATDVVAHVLNDEVSRKWIQAVKRYVLPRLAGLKVRKRTRRDGPNGSRSGDRYVWDIVRSGRTK